MNLNPLDAPAALQAMVRQTIVKPAMIQLKDIFHHPAALLGTMLLGGWVGTLLAKCRKLWRCVRKLRSKTH